MITVFGSINMDLIATTDRLPKPGETVAGNGFATAAGGKGANQALAAQRAGRVVHMVGAVGKDDFAAPALALLDQAGTQLSGVKHVDGPTGTALILVGGDGENMIAVVPGANGTLTAADADRALDAMREGDILVLQLEVPGSAVEHALAAARRKGRHHHPQPRSPHCGCPASRTSCRYRHCQRNGVRAPRWPGQHERSRP